MNKNSSDDFIVISKSNSIDSCLERQDNDHFNSLTSGKDDSGNEIIALSQDKLRTLMQTNTKDENLSESISQINIKASAKKSNENSKINPADFLYHKYNSKVVKNKKCRKKLLNKHKSYMNELKYNSDKNYYNEKQDQTDKNEYYSNLDDKFMINYEDLHNLISSTKKVFKRGNEIYSIIDRHPDGTLRDIYTNNIIEDEKGIPQVEAYNEEHSFPQCYQAGTNSGAGKDLHQIFASDKSVNYARGKKQMGLLEGSVFVKESKCGIIYKCGKDKSFVPFHNKGAIARAFLYILVCYGKICDQKKFPKAYLSYVVEAASSEPVTIWEKHRNAEIYQRQGNRNPFIDFPEWARIIDFENNGFR